MATSVAGWILDNSASSRSDSSPYREQLELIAERLHLCPVAQLEILYSSRSAADYDERKAALRGQFQLVDAPVDALARALVLQRDLAHHHGMWHRTPIPDLLIAVTALHHGLGVVHVDHDFERIAEVRSLTVRRLG